MSRVDSPTMLNRQTETFLVRGTVTDPEGRPARGLTVVAFDQDLRKRQELGRAPTGKDGRYEIAYDAGQFRHAEKAGADLVVEVQTADGEVLYTSDVRFNTSPQETIDVSLTRLGSEAEFDRIVRELIPVLEGQDVGFDTLEEDAEHRDITFAGGETGIPQERLTAFAVAHRLPRIVGQRPKLEPLFWFAAFRSYAFLLNPPEPKTGIEGLARTVLAELPRRSWPDLETGLRQAFERNVIAKSFEKRLAAWEKSYRVLRKREAGKEAALLTLAGIPDGEHEAFLDALHAGGSHAEVLARMPQRLTGSSAKIEVTLALNDFTLGDRKLLAALQPEVTEPVRLRHLARKTPEEWKQVIERAGSAPPDSVAGKDEREKRSNYAALLAQRARLAYPTAAFAGDLERALAAPEALVADARPALQHAREILEFLDARPELELGTTSLADVEGEFAGELRAVQRVFKLAPSFAAANTLLADGVHSAHAVYQMGETQFVRSFAESPGFDETTAREAYQRAANTYAAVATIVGDLRATQNANDVLGLTNEVAALSRLPDLASLFGKADLCECAHCRSIFSPAAYLADLLMFLKARRAVDNGPVKDVLFKRRPDLGTIELSCDNSNTQLPYVDLACELLEERVAPTGQARQTHGTAEERAAYPEYVNDAAYQKLRLPNRNGPLTLPFDLDVEEVRAYLGLVGIRRFELMTIFRGPAAPNNPSDVDIAAELLGIAKAEQDLIFVEGEVDVPSPFTVDVFLNRTGLEYSDLQRLLTLLSLNSGGAIRIEHKDSSCDTNRKELQGVVTGRVVDRIYRFLRLWRKLGWEMWEVDLVLEHPALGNDKLDRDLASLLRPLLQLKERLALSVDQLCSLFGDIDIVQKLTKAFHTPEPSLYERLFLDPRVTNPPDPELAIAKVAAKNPTQRIDDHLPPVLAALSLSSAELATFRGLSGPGLVIDDKLSLKNLSFLHRHAVMSRRLRISAADWRALLLLLKIDPFTGPVATLAFVELVDRIQASGLTIGQLSYILRADLTAAAAETEANVAAALTALRESLGTAAEPLRKDVAIQQLSAALRLTPALAEKLLVMVKLFGTPDKHPLLEEYTADGFAKSTIPVTRAAFKDQYDGFYWLHRAATVCLAFAVTSPDLDWMLREPAKKGVLDLAVLPVVFDASRASTPAPLLNLGDFLRLSRAVAKADLSLLAVVDRLIANVYGNAEGLAADVEKLTGWPKADVKAVIELDDGLAAYQKIEAWQRLQKAVAMLKRLNGDARSVLPLAGAAVGFPESAALKRMLRSKYDEKAWLDLSKPIQNALRERKRDSLVAYLLAQPRPANASSEKWDHPNDLYAYNLIDVEMCSCQLTSRIVQASAAVQLFVQRCFLGLEPDVRASAEEDDGWSQWKWTQYYRVWEANRRVFAHPENYAEPDLRRDKSELFASFEDELLQNEVNRDNVEKAFLRYVERLDEIAQLEVAGTWHQESNNTLHVFGCRPNSDPRTYYYRKLLGERRWTAWSRVDCDIKFEYVVPLMANERLYLVWPELREEPVPIVQMSVPAPGDSVTPAGPGKKYKISLAVTERKNEKWAPKKLSQDSFDTGGTFGIVIDSETCALIPFDFTGWSPSPGQPKGPLLVSAETPVGEFVFELTERGCPKRFASSLYPDPFPRSKGHFLIDYPVFPGAGLRRLKDVAPESINKLTAPFTGEVFLMTPGGFKITYPHYMSGFDRKRYQPSTTGEQRVSLGSFYSWFYADPRRTFFVQPKLVGPPGSPVLFYKDMIDGGIDPRVPPPSYRLQLEFSSFYHPLTSFSRELSARGVEGLLARETQLADTGFDFATIYKPTPVVDPGVSTPTDPHPKYPREIVDFALDGSYSFYNWELFFHVPLLIADRLSKEQRFEDALRWFHFIFDPTGARDRDPNTGQPVPSPQKFWITKPFYQRQDPEYQQQRIENLLRLLATDPANPTPPALVQELIQQVQDWRDDPFDPHLIAQFRTVAYQKLTVMKYIENLIAWGDQRFRADTLESVNEAAQLYVLAAEILGPRPRRVPPAGEPRMQTFNQLESKLDAFSNAIVALENMVPPMPGGGGGSQPLAPLPGLYFCIPQNDQLLRLWDTVADRLYKIRHCLNIEGVARQLALFAPPIDPALLVRAMAAGVDIASALTGLEVSLPPYRFTTMIQKANELVNDVKSLGAALLAALEKKDAEALALLRQGQESAVLQAARDVKQKQIDDAQHALEAGQRSLEAVIFRRDYYATRPYMNPGETVAMVLSLTAGLRQSSAHDAELLGGMLAAIPDFDVGAEGAGGSPASLVTTGGKSLSAAVDLAAQAMAFAASVLDREASLASTRGGYDRRRDDWEMQREVADRETKQIEKQIASAEVRLAIAQQELANHDLQIANAQALDDFMRSKYTSQELYQWMTGQISQTYFQTYQLAGDLARRAEQCLRYEIGDEKISLIRPGLWDSLRKGLLAGERLQLDLRRLEGAYLDRNRRELECTKHVSLALLDPQALLDLKDQGKCGFDLPEEVLDLDFPGHYFRRIKSVSLSIPCVAGPQTTVSCSLRLNANRVRIDATATSGDDYPYKGSGDTRFRESRAPVKSIATSSGQNDSGLFELSFNDARYLPFEGAGVISSWQVELMEERQLRQLDYQTISDVILHVRYTAREDGNLKIKAIDHLKKVITGAATQLPLRRLFDLKHEFPTEWYAFFHPASGAQKVLRLPVRKQHFPALAQEGTIRIKAVSLVARVTGTDLFAKLGPPFKAEAITLARPAGLFHVGTQAGLDAEFDETKPPWELRLGKTATDFEGLTFDDVKECYLIIQYTASTGNH